MAPHRAKANAEVDPGDYDMGKGLHPLCGDRKVFIPLPGSHCPVMHRLHLEFSRNRQSISQLEGFFLILLCGAEFIQRPTRAASPA